MPQSANFILNSLPADIFAALKPNLNQVDLGFDTFVSETGEYIEHVHFPHSAVMSLVVELKDGRRIEAAMVGCDGVVNGTSALDGRMSLHQSIVQLAGASSAIRPDALRALANKYGLLHSMIIRHEQVLLSQAMQSAACQASHSLEERMCRWLLRMHDLAHSDHFALTQDYLAQLLGVRRTSVSVVAGTLQRAGFISYRHGQMKLLDIDALRDAACECYQKVRDDYEMLLGPEHKMQAVAAG